MKSHYMRKATHIVALMRDLRHNTLQAYYDSSRLYVQQYAQFKKA